MAEQEPIQAIQEPTRNRIDPTEALALVWNKRKFVAAIVGTITIVSVIVSLLLTPYYKSTATILPETQSSKFSSLGGLSDLAALAGVSVGAEGSLIKLYPTIIKSEAVLKDVIYARYKTEEFSDSVNLIQFWKLKESKPGGAYENALVALRERLDVSMDLKTSILSMSLETREPKLSASVVNNVADGLNRFILTKRSTSASEQRKFIEGRLAEVKDDLTNSEEALKVFRERNSQVRSPQLMLEQGRLERDLQINSTLFIELKKQYELAKIEEVKNLPVINTLDRARSAVFAEGPKKKVIVAMSFIMSLLFSIGWIIFNRYYFERSKTWLGKVHSYKP